VKNEERKTEQKLKVTYLLNGTPTPYKWSREDKMSLYGLALCRAARIIDDQPQLSYFLGVAPSKLSLWSSSAETAPPLTIFLRAVDIVLAESLRVDKPITQEGL
jgi:hypothetical protein